MASRHNADPSSAVRASTIALLQERFKKLQRVREMREAEREVLQYRLRRESSETPPPQSPQPKWLFPAGAMPASATVHAGGHHHHHHHHHHHRGEVLDTSLSVGLCPRRSFGGGGGDQGLGLMTMSSETDVVDTSLHL